MMPFGLTNTPAVFQALVNDIFCDFINHNIFVPEDARPEVLQWAHSSSLACHPGVRRTLALLSRRFWWPSARRDLEEFVVACPVCARAKGTSQRPQGLLQPLPVPHRPWSHIVVDFVTGLPESQGSSMILTIFDRFSKSAHLVELPKLPSAKETTQLKKEKSLRCLVEGSPSSWAASLPWCLQKVNLLRKVSSRLQRLTDLFIFAR